MQFHKLGLARASAVMAVVLLNSASSQAQIPYGGHYYEVIPAPGITWMGALAGALSLTYDPGSGPLVGHLATITSAGEDAAVGAAVAAGGSGEFWLGGYQNPSSETTPTAGWTWVNSEGTFPGVNGASGFANSYSNWNPGEPNDAYGPGSEQFLGINLGIVGGFNDEAALGLIGGYVVEYDPVTVPGGGLVPDGGSTAFLLFGGMALLGGYSRRFRK